MLFALITTTALWFLLPFVPALVELRRQRDAAPLHVADAYAEDLRQAPHRFEASIRPHLARLHAYRRYGAPTAPVGPGEGTFQLLDATTPAAPSAPPIATDAETAPEAYILLTDRPSLLPGNLRFTAPIYSTATLATGSDTDLEALFGEQDVHLSGASRVHRWVHSKGTLVVGPGSTLSGTASAEGALYVHADCVFQHLHAPTLVFVPTGVPASTPAPVFLHTSALLPIFTPPGQRDAGGTRCLVEGDLVIPGHHAVEGDLVVTGRLRVGAGALLRGSVKTHGDLVVERQARIRGSLFSNRNITLDEQCQVEGVIAAEGRLAIGAYSLLGTPRQRTTVTARALYVAPGVRAHGTVWALEDGWTG